MMEEKPLVTLTADDLKTKYKLRPYFIRTHGAAMGAFGKPKRWIEEEVVAYLRELGSAARRAREEAAAKTSERLGFIQDKIREIRSLSSTGSGKVGDIKGRGGRTGRGDPSTDSRRAVGKTA